MKRCPLCRRDYTDETLNFCLDDGTALLEGPGSGEAETAIFGSAVSGSAPVLGNLPAERTRFVGRASELSDCVRLVAATRLLTITGVGGSGKTRLAIKLAESVREDFPDGTWFIDLSPIADESMIAPALARVLDLREEASVDLLDALVRRVASRRLLVVFDNCEHMLAAVVRLIDELLTSAPNLNIVATSREALNVQGERVFALQPLSVPAAVGIEKSELRSDAVDLFVDRAAVAHAGFALTDDNLETVVDIVRQLDGIPLAIELAAARLKVLSIEQIHQRLKERFRLLAGSGEARVPRHKTLQAAIEWSYDPLPDEEKRLLRALSIFPDGCDLEAITQVYGCADEFACLDLLAKLVDKSLVIAESGHGSQKRYKLLETVRQFALALLSEHGEGEAIRRAHFNAMLSLAEKEYRKRTVQEDESADVLEIETSNLQQALEFARENDREAYLQLAGALGWYWTARSHVAEGRRHLSAALLATSPEPPRVNRARALWGAAHLLAWSGDLDAAQRWTDEALASCRELGDTPEVAAVLEGIGWSRFSSGKDEEARASFEECLRIQKATGDPILINRANVGLAQALVALGRIDEARPMALEIIEFSKDRADKRNEHFGWHYLADCALIEGNCGESLKLYKQSLALAAATGDKVETAFEVQGVAMSLAGLGRWREAEVLDAAVHAELDRIGANPHFGFWDALLEKYLGSARENLGSIASEEAEREGASLSFDDAIANALDAEDAGANHAG